MFVLEQGLPTSSLCRVFPFIPPAEGVRGRKCCFRVVESNIWNTFVLGDGEVETWYVAHRIALLISVPRYSVFAKDS